MDSEDQIWLALAHLNLALKLATSALELIDAPTTTTLAELATLAELRSGLEVSTTALLVQRGVSWQAMADVMRVSRQSLNRRVGRKINLWQNEVANQRRDSPRQQPYDWARFTDRLKDQTANILLLNPAAAARAVSEGQSL